jgi:hypothetical protein
MVLTTPQLKYFISGLLFLVLAIITLRIFLFGDHLFIYRDVVWPPITSQFSNVLYTLDLESARRIIFLGPFFSAVKFLGLSSLTSEKLLFLFTRFFAGFFSYLCVHKFLTTKVQGSDKNLIFIISLFAGFFYAYNPIATTMISTTIFFAFSYSLIPLIFYFFDKTLNEKGFYNIFVTSALISLAMAGVTQYLVLLPLLLIVPWLLIVCIQRKTTGKSIYLTIKNFLLVVLLSFLMSFYWIIVSISEITRGATLRPEYILTYDILHTFSAKTSLTDVFRLLGDWLPRLSLIPPPIINQSVWTIMTFIIPISMVVFLLFPRHSKLRFYLISFSLISIFVMFFHKGIQPPITGFYPHLYDIPVVGWMFRVPSKFAMFLTFYIMMILSLGFYDILSLKLKNRVKKYVVKYIPLLGFIGCMSLIVWPMFTGDFGGIYEKSLVQKNVIPNTNVTMGISKENIALFGGLDKFGLLGRSGLISPADSSLIFVDQKMYDFNSDILRSIDKIVMEDKASLMMQLLSSNSVIIKPFDATNRYFPSKVWSKVTTNDLQFHKYLEDQYAIKNSDLDYGKGIAFTSGQDKIGIPIEIKGHDHYDLYLRYLKNAYGGSMKIYLDENPIGTVNTQDEHNKFVWENIGTFDMTNGKHVLTLENIDGLNAVNIFVLIPSREIPQLINQVNYAANKTRNIFLLDPRSDFHTQQGYANNNNQEGGVLVLSPNSEISTNLDVLKKSQYGVAIKVKTCQQCSSLSIRIGDAYKELSLKNDKTELKWLYVTAILNPGNTDLRIYSAVGAADLKMIVIYSDSYPNETLDNVFAQKNYGSMLGYRTLDPTKYEVKINAVRPFILKFTEPYALLWEAHVNGELGRNGEKPPIQLYPTINGFIIDQTGKLDVLIEYGPQKWFYIGGLISIITFAASVCYLISQRWRGLLKLVLTLKSTSDIRSYLLQQRTLCLSKEHAPLSIGTELEQNQEQQQDQPGQKWKIKNAIKVVEEPRFPIAIALILLVCMPFLLILKQPNVNTIMIVVYILLVIGLITLFIHCLRKKL